MVVSKSIVSSDVPAQWGVEQSILDIVSLMVNTFGDLLNFHGAYWSWRDGLGAAFAEDLD